MIKSKQDYLDYLEADRKALQLEKTRSNLIYHEVWKFQRLLRKAEYYYNCNKPKLAKTCVFLRFRRMGTRLGFTIPPNAFGPGLAIAHKGTIVVNGAARIGKNCRLHVCVSIGTEAGKDAAAPTIGDNCYIGPGVKMFGRIIIGDNMVIGANAVVNKSFPEGNATIAGVPAKMISDTTSEGLLVKGC